MQIVGARGDGHLARAQGACSRPTAPSRAGRASPTTACSPAGWSSRACASCSSSTGAGTSTAPTPGEDIRDGLTQEVRHDGPAGRRPDPRPEAARAARRDADHLGRRVRPHAVPRRPHRRRATSSAATTIPTASRCWLAGGGVKGGITHGESDELGFSVADDKVHVHDLQATILHLLGFDHTRLTYRFQGRDYRLTDVEGQVVKEILT